MYRMFQSLLAAALVVAQVVALLACNEAGLNASHTITVFTTITPTVTNFCLGPSFTNLVPTSTQIGTAAVMRNDNTPAPTSTFAGRPSLALTNPVMAYEAAIASLTSLTMCEGGTGNFSFNTTKMCPSSTSTTIVSSDTLMPANTSTILSTTDFPTLPLSSSDTAESTSTTMVVVSLVTGSDGSIATATVPPGITSVAKASATPANGTNTATSTSAACPQPQPLRPLFWLNGMAAKALVHILRAFGDWVDAEKAKSFLSTEGAMLDSLTAVSDQSGTTSTPPPPAVTKSAAALLAAPCLLGGTALISIFC